MVDVLSCEGIDLEEWYEEQEKKRVKTLLELAQQKNAPEKEIKVKVEEEEEKEKGKFHCEMSSTEWFFYLEKTSYTKVPL